LICGSGIGISIAANRFPHIRAALCKDVVSCELARLHNDANILVLGGRLISKDLSIECINKFLNTNFEGGRHINRVNKLSNPPIL
jgi:ribose 5-phosphate isomerase B